MGILFVHGIGHQTRGDTLARFGDALIQWLSQVLPGTCIARASLDSDGTREHPSYAEISVADQQKKPQARWVAAEGFWADTVITPRFSDMLRWSLHVLPWTALNHFDRLVQRSWSTTGTLRGFNEFVLGVPGAVAVLLSLVFGLLLVPLVAIALVVILLLGLLPIPALQSFAAAAQRTLAGTVGDSMILLASPVQRAAIIDRVHDAYRWLVESGCESVVVIAHSQGAAVAHEMLRTRERPRVSLFVSLGSGLRKLHEIEEAMEDGSPALWFASLCAIALVVVSYELLHFAGLVALPLLVVVVGIGLAWGMFTMQGWHFVERMVFWVIYKFRKRPEGLEGCLWEFGVSITTFVITLIVTAIACPVGAWLLARVMLPGEMPWFVTALVVLESMLVVATMFLLFAWRGIKPLNKSGDPELVEVPYEYRLEKPPRWVDIYAAADPVPNGPLAEGLRKHGDSFESVEVENRSSYLLDHTTYWLNIEQVVTRIGREALRQGGLETPVSVGDEKQQELWERRRLRVRAFKRARLGIGLAVLLAASANWHWLIAHCVELRPSLARLAAEVPLVGKWIAAAVLLDEDGIAIASLYVLLVAGLCHGVLASLWSAWDRSASRAFLRSDPDKHAGARPLFYAAVLVFALVAALLAAYAVALRVAPYLAF
jgi:hypothetical protein